MKDNNEGQRPASFSRTLSKKTLLAKIRNTVGKDIVIPDASKKTPRKFIVKRSNERVPVN